MGGGGWDFFLPHTLLAFLYLFWFIIVYIFNHMLGDTLYLAHQPCLGWISSPLTSLSNVMVSFPFILPISPVWAGSPLFWLPWVMLWSISPFFHLPYSFFPLIQAYPILNNQKMILKLFFFLLIYSLSFLCRLFPFFHLPISKMFLCLKPDVIFHQMLF